MMLDRRKGERRVTPPHLTRPPVGVLERRQGPPRRALDRLQEELVQKLDVVAGGHSGVPRRAVFEQVLSHIGTYLARSFQVEDDEVGILLVKAEGELLRFAYPPELYQGGLNFFPITVPSVAGRVVRGKQGIIHNDMAMVPHLHIYERIRLTERPVACIQRMLAVPLLHLGHPVGVIEVCRKASTPMEAGPDFTELDLLKLTDFGRVLAAYLVRFIPDDF